MARSYTYNVAPRWTGGSPAQVDFATAQRVLYEEQVAHQMALSGTYGDEKARLAAELPYALRGIVEERIEHSDGWLVRDLLSREVCYRFARRRDGRPPTLAARSRAHYRVVQEARVWELDGVVPVAEEVRQ